MEQHCPDTCAIFKGTPQEVAENRKLFREGGYYVFRCVWVCVCVWRGGVMFHSFMGTTALHPLNPHTFKTHHHAHRDPATRLRTLVLNSGLWSPRYDNADLPKSMPDAHMAWVSRQLKAAQSAGEKVGEFGWVVGWLECSIGLLHSNKHMRLHRGGVAYNPLPQHQLITTYINTNTQHTGGDHVSHPPGPRAAQRGLGGGVPGPVHRLVHAGGWVYLL